MAETKARHIANLVEDDGDVKSAHLDNTTSATPTAVSDQANTSTGYIDVPSGTTAQRPGSPNAGNLRLNTDDDTLEFYTGTAWAKTNEPTPIITSISGNVYSGTASNLTITGADFNPTNISIEWLDGSTQIAKEDNITPTSATSVTRAVPASVYGKASGTTIGIKILNVGSVASTINTSKSVLVLPSGGTITQVGTPTCYVHTFLASCNPGFCNTISNLSVCYLVIAGGGGGGPHGGGGGAGGLLTNTTTLSTGTTIVEVGNGGASDTNGQNSCFGSSIVTCGGGAGAFYTNNNGHNGCNGGSGGGATFCIQNSTGLGGSGTPGQGCNGGTGITWNNNSNHSSAGGGGRGGCGVKHSSDTGLGHGGIGLQNAINGTNHYWAGGGGGGIWTSNSVTPGSGGCGGGGGGRNSNGGTSGANGGGAMCTASNFYDGAPNTGAGGGGGCSTAGAGGKGIVILRYCLP